ncbi:CocE/NonD family hydrolase [Candidatus Spongiihabitans sp.]|uniref:CocE/NonD family hydrolase n=1 Tax=Candidatus Spongiihabitans sp. TaxID=3101308 RepID=UPI003C6EE8F0
MTTVTSFSRSVKEIENIWITLSDGLKLSARIWMPEDAPSNPVPAILEYLPYRKRDGTCERDTLTYPYFAGHGYVGVRVDLRGNGESDGLMLDEYLKQEQDDALEVIDWLTRQPWCDGNVGMMGISWGGFNSLQVAACRPHVLKAIISLCSTDNRYSDDIHYKGGALLMENLGWASTMFSYSSRPPDPLLRPDDWEEIWMQRLKNTPLLIEKWLSHPNQDDLWKHGSIDRNYAAIEAATLLIGGWHDAYSNTVPRMLECLECPRQGIIGPWAHKYPHIAVPQPRIGFLQIAVRWWDHWLKGIDNGVMTEPLYRAYLMDGIAPQSSYQFRPGCWVAEHRWPSDRVKAARFFLRPDGLSRVSDGNADTRAEHRINSPEDTGTNGGEFCIMWSGPDWPTDQRDDDARSLVFDAEVLDDPLILFGAPEITLALEADHPHGNVIARLCDVAADGASALITYGVLNLAHRRGFEHPQPMIPGRRETVKFKLDDCGYVVPAGHRIRVAVSTAHWPLLWPSACNTTLKLYAAECRIDLPRYENAGGHADGMVPEFPQAVTCEPYDQQTLTPANSFRKVTKDLGKQITDVEILNDFGKSKSNVHGLITHETNHELHTIDPGDPLSARSRITGTQLLQRDKWKTLTETTTEMWCDQNYFHVKANLKAYKNDSLVFERSWDKSISR